MDDPLVPKEYGSGTKWLGICASLSAFIFVLVAVVLAAASGTPGWIVAAIGMFMIIGTTGSILQWIRSGQLEEAKHTYLVAVQVLGLMVIAGAVLDILYTKTAAYPVVGTVTGAFPSPNVLTQGSMSFNGGAPLALQQGYVMPFVLAEAAPDGSTVGVVMVKQPGQAFCTVHNGQGHVSGGVYNAVNVSCATRYNIGGTLSGTFTGHAGYTPLVLSAQLSPPPKDGGKGTITQSLSADGSFWFDDKVEPGTSAYITITSSPAPPGGDPSKALKCNINNNPTVNIPPMESDSSNLLPISCT